MLKKKVLPPSVESFYTAVSELIGDCQSRGMDPDEYVDREFKNYKEAGGKVQAAVKEFKERIEGGDGWRTDEVDVLGRMFHKHFGLKKFSVTISCEYE